MSNRQQLANNHSKRQDFVLLGYLHLLYTLRLSAAQQIYNAVCAHKIKS